MAGISGATGKLICSAVIGEGMMEWAGPVLAAHAAYAVRTGADYCLQTTRHISHGRHAGWEKLDAIGCFARQTRYRTMLWLDADALPMPALEDVFDRSGFWAEPDQGRPEIDERFNAFMASLGDPPASGLYFNSGVFLLDVETAQRMLPWLVLPSFEMFFWDQDVLNRALLRAGVMMQPLSDAYRYNWMAPQHVEAARRQKIVHFAGGATHLIGEVLA